MVCRRHWVNKSSILYLLRLWHEKAVASSPTLTSLNQLEYEPSWHPSFCKCTIYGTVQFTLDESKLAMMSFWTSFFPEEEFFICSAIACNICLYFSKEKEKKKKKAFLLWFIYSNWYLYYPAVHCSTPIQASEGKWAEYIISYQNSLRNLVAIFSLQVFQVLRILHTSFYLKI